MDFEDEQPTKVEAYETIEETDRKWRLRRTHENMAALDAPEMEEKRQFKSAA